MSYVRATTLGKSRDPTFKYAEIFIKEYILNVLVIQSSPSLHLLKPDLIQTAENLQFTAYREHFVFHI
jgi:hypothetical protein